MILEAHSIADASSRQRRSLLPLLTAHEAALDLFLGPSLVLDYPRFSGLPGWESQHSLPDKVVADDLDVKATTRPGRNRVCSHTTSMARLELAGDAVHDAVDVLLCHVVASDEHAFVKRHDGLAGLCSDTPASGKALAKAGYAL